MQRKRGTVLANTKPIRPQHRSKKSKRIECLFWICIVAAVTALIFSSYAVSTKLSKSSSSLEGSQQERSFSSTTKKERPLITVKEQNYHVLFSTSCDPFQNWQSLAFFYFANRVQQPGKITRIVSGCTKEKAEALQKVHNEKVASMSTMTPSRFHIHITPDFGHGPGDQKYWNKPFGLLHYMETEMGYSATATENENKNPHDDDIIIIMDPDMMLLKPITADFSDYVGLWTNELPHIKVDHGQPIAQRYEYGSQWLTSLHGNLIDVVGPNSPALNVSLQEANLYYPAGPPYLATAKDMYRIVTHWVEFLPKIFQHFTGMMAEMHGYSTAAAHLQLPHKLARGFMVSTIATSENFDFVDSQLNRTTACEAAAVGSEYDRQVSSSLIMSTQRLPYVLHYCQRYALGRFFFSKYKLNENFFDCDAPLMREPPLNVGDIYDWFIFPNGFETKDFSDPSKPQDVNGIIRNGWMMCSIIFGLNDAATSLKKRACLSPNLEKTWHFHEEDKFQQMLSDPSNPFHQKNTSPIKTG